MACDGLPLHLELDNGNGLVHLGRQAGIHRVVNVFVQNLRHEALTRIVLVNPGCKHGQRAQVDAVAVL